MDPCLPFTGALEQEVSVFETMRSYGGFILGLPEHYERVSESARTLGLDLRWTFEEFKQEIQNTLTRFGKTDALLRPTFFKGQFHFFIKEVPVLSPSLYENGIDLKTAPDRLADIHSAPVGAKSNWYGPQALTHLGHFADCFEILFLDTLGFVGELRINNLFILRKGVLKTPPAVHILNGVTRRFVLRIAEGSGIPVQETVLTRHEIFNAEECFITNSVVEILPVRSLDGRRIGEASQRPITSLLQERYQKTIKKSWG